MSLKAQNYHNASIEELEKLTTSQLLRLRDLSFSTVYDDYDYHTENEMSFNNSQYVLREKLNKILPTREHVLNKAEAKLARRQRAHNQRNR
jgi:hypothetical protein